MLFNQQYALVPVGQSLVIDNRLGGDLDIGYPCGNLWCMSDAQTDPRTLHPHSPGVDAF
eukprot:CAMPEP_0181326968 /NCGR_PEP_ID=MMETSP1101-20121128/21815_1 /TAXON_ID=46948 /ORGANISM="Rhodomonas abbreviata, Strain Caron Lab Isolate" /LENGTH=58 /DNA_ID=CAMNT_0023435525 /DNA_START=15 /DNA_END=191 /DNA_ORIENTATION=+